MESFLNRILVEAYLDSLNDAPKMSQEHCDRSRSRVMSADKSII